MKTHLRIPIAGQSEVHVYVHTPDLEKPRASVIFSHGFSVAGFESRRMFLEIADLVVDNGYASVLFDYRGSGYSDLAFEEMTLQTEMEDLKTVSGYVKEKLFPNIPFVVWGMSFGAGVASIVMANDEQVRGIILWCLSADLYNRYKKRLGPDIEAKGFTYTDKGFRVKSTFLDSLIQNDVHDAIAAIRAPLLLVHGDSDTVAPVELSLRAFEIAKCPKRIELIPGGVHGFKSQPSQYNNAVATSINWLNSL